MSDPIRMLHFADTHIGVENYGAIDPATGISSRVLDFLRRIDDLIDFAGENDADLAIFAGDAFKSRYPSPTHQREFARRIKRLAEICPVVLVVGNHDRPAMVQKASSVEIFHTLDVPNVEQRRKGRRHLNLTNDSEKRIGEWNEMKVVCHGNEIRVYVNGDLVNHATNCSATRGAIAVQSEGRPIHFRNIRLTPMPE